MRGGKLHLSSEWAQICKCSGEAGELVPLWAGWGGSMCPGSWWGQRLAGRTWLQTGQCHHSEYKHANSIVWIIDQDLSVCLAKGGTFTHIFHLMFILPWKIILSTVNVNKQTLSFQARHVGSCEGIWGFCPQNTAESDYLHSSPNYVVSQLCNLGQFSESPSARFPYLKDGIMLSPWKTNHRCIF